MIVAGLGFRNSASTASLRNALEKAGDAQALATLADKARHPALTALAQELSLPIIETNPDSSHEERAATRSIHSEKHRGFASVSEASALAAAGPGARLLAPRVISDDRLATCALAQSATTGPET